MNVNTGEIVSLEEEAERFAEIQDINFLIDTYKSLVGKDSEKYKELRDSFSELLEKECERKGKVFLEKLNKG